MPAIMLWNIEHTSGFQDVFSSKNAFINEVLGIAVDQYDIAAVILLEITTKESVDQYAYNRGFNSVYLGEGTALKYGILSKAVPVCTDVTAYFTSFADKQRGIAHIQLNSGGIPPLLVTHIKSDQGLSGAACLQDICLQVRENMQSGSRNWPQSGVMALADWNLKADDAIEVTRVAGGQILAPDEPTRYSKVPATQIMQPLGEAKTLDYACVFGTLRERPTLRAFVPDVYYYRTVLDLMDTYLKRVQAVVADIGPKLTQNEVAVTNALMQNMPAVRTNALLNEQSALAKDLQSYELAAAQIAAFRERLARRDRLNEADRRVLHQLITQTGMGPDHLPVIISW